MLLGDLFAVSSALFWSFSVILMRIAGYQIPPIPLTFFKNCIAIICLVSVMLVLGESFFIDLSRADYLRLTFSAVIGICFADPMIAAALNRLGASLQALADCAYSPAITCIGFLMFGERLTNWELIGGFLVVSGVFVGATMTAEIKSSKDLMVGILLAASAHIIMAFSILMVRDIYRDSSIFWVSGYRYLIATIAMIAWAYIRHPHNVKEKLFLGFYRPDTWKTMIPMAVFGSFLAATTWMAGFKYLEAGRAAIYNQLSTVFIILLAYFLLKEEFTWRKAIGVVLALIGAYLVASQ